MRWLPLAVLLLAPLVAAQAPDAPAGPPASFLVYHAPGGREPDPLASVLAPPPAGAERLPATLFDGVERADPAPENAPERALAHYREMQRRLLSRESAPPGVELRLDGALTGDALHVSVAASGPATLSVVVFEHGVDLAGRPRPYVARFAFEPTTERTLASEVHLQRDWDPEKLGFVAIARNGSEVVQSATWTVAGDAPVVQTQKSVLVEHVTASWCDACGPADEAIALLATQRGVAGPLAAGEVQYLRAPSWLLYAGLAMGALAAVAVLRRRDA
ncbi:MAG TPA: hypothetical protein VM370_03300 [Candidatus Thermoplasmatota archaeon]|nr:hypothetical protein [Candidatus Thermoplasmatota archaeon]